MAYLRRKIDEYLEKWKNDPKRLPLVVKGARQIGKTESIRRFAYKNYENVIEINFIEMPKFRTILSDGYSVDDIIKNITMLDTNISFKESSTLLFFDEMQAYPDIMTALKFFAIDERFDVICSGSLLGINYKQIESISVGYRTEYEMYSLDFEEFLWAKGYDDSLKNVLLNHMIESKPFGDTTFQTLKDLFMEHTIIGGMPKVVSMYVESGSFSGTLDCQRQIVSAYREDIRKYTSGTDQTKVTRVFDSIPFQLAKDNKKFQFTKLGHGARFSTHASCVEWLQDAGIAKKCYCLSFPELPLKGNCDDSKFKLYMADTGLLISMLDDEAQEDLRTSKNFNTYNGAICENIVAEELLKSGYPLYYYRRDDSTLEQDFFIRSSNGVVPIEVKATDGRSKSMRQLITSDLYPLIKWGVKLSLNNIGFEKNIYTFPYFCTFLLKEWMKLRETNYSSQ
ncbi:MAG: ATP-binding protein [Erysipelotrichaceae bacterium]|nr:ATP-binding protein [Erysipelotrichaceae bacterium]